MAHSTLRPGQRRFDAPYAILGGAKVAGTTVLNASSAPGSFSWPRIQTPFVTEILSRGIAPRISYTVAPQVSVTVHPVGGEQGPLHYTYAIACAGRPGGAIQDSGDRWHTVAGTRVVIPLLPGCLRLTDLAFVAGWVGHPVARLRYHSA
jgi:hypothetical protein